MGVRQTSTPLGMLVAAVAVPPIAATHGLHGAVLFVGVLSGVMAVLTALFIVDPPRPAPKAAGGEKPPSPYRTPTLWRIHGASALMVWPQFTVGAFGLVYLTDVRHWSAVAAGQLMACGQALAAACRIGAGRWSDAVGSRLRPMRWLAAAVGVLGVGLAVAGDSAVGVALLIVLCGLSASTNGLSFTSVAELAGPRWAGRALAVQNTGQNLTASLCPPVVGALISASGFGPAFAVAAVCAFASIAALPRR
jgi:predicted MFS family arabinose efflux permease